MKRLAIFGLLLCMSIMFTAPASASEPDPVLHQKAYDYVNWLLAQDFWGWGGVSEMQFTDETLVELEHLRGTGDSCIWTGMYLGSQALRYISTGDQEAADEVHRIADYLHILLDITDTPGFVARYAAPDEDPWNREYPPGDEHKVLGVGPYEGAFWVDHTSRDQYTGWFYGLTLAYEATDDPDLQAQICADESDVIEALRANNWKIVDQYGQIWSASYVLPSMRLSWLAQAAHVCGEDEEYWALFDEQYEKFKTYLWLDTFSFFNKYSQYYGFNLAHTNWFNLFRLVPDRQRLQHLYRVWDYNIRRWTKDTHNAWFDAAHLIGCTRAGMCDEGELDHVMEEISTTLTDFQDAPNQAFNHECEELPLDPFSVLWDRLEDLIPFLEDIFNIDPQTKEPHEFADRCWSDMVWQRTPYHVTCRHYDVLNQVGPGVDYMVAYWSSYYYGFLPGDGPFGDDDPIDDDTAIDDDTFDDDAIDDDAVDDDLSPDDDSLGNDDVGDDDVDSADDDQAYDDDDDDDGCGC